MDQLVLRSSVKLWLKQKVVFKGTLLASLGALLLLYVGAFMPPNILGVWGWMILLFGLWLISFGLLPYRKLCRLETQYHEIILTDHREMLVALKKNPTCSIPLSSIAHVAYLEYPQGYGIGVWLKKPTEDKVVIYDPKFLPEQSVKPVRQMAECDLFIPYFSARAFDSLQEYLNP